MKLVLNGHDERYTVEQSLMNLFPGELPVYEPVLPGDESWATITLRESPEDCRVTVELRHGGKTAAQSCRTVLTGTDFEKEGQRRHAIARCFFLAARAVTGATPPWGMLTGVRPDKPVTWALAEGKTPDEARAMLENEYFVTPERAALALETGAAALTAARRLGPRDIDVYVGIPFCPTRCAYCSFVSASVEKTFSMIDPYLDALEDEIALMGETVRELGLRIKSVYMGGGTPTTLSAPQLERLLSALEAHFDLTGLAEYTVEAGRPDTVTEEKLRVLHTHGVTRVSINPQTMEDHVLRAIGRRHSAEEVLRAMDLARKSGIPHINMDLIAGLPEDTPEGFRRTLDTCLALKPDNLTVHTLALKKGSRIMLDGLAIPGAAEVGQMLDYANAALSAAGYEPYYLYRQKYMSGNFENVGWSKPGAEGLYNIYIMEELHTILSLGAGGSTKMVDPRIGRIERYYNCKFAKEYIEKPEKRHLDRDQFAAFERALLESYGQVRTPEERTEEHGV